MTNETRFWTIFTGLSVALLVALLAYDAGRCESGEASPSSSVNDEVQPPVNLASTADDPDPLSTECLDHDGLARHDHVTLEIHVDGVQQTVESNIGIQTEVCYGSENNMHAVHTHDTSGRLHIELNEAGDVPLGVFFDIWGVHFNETGIFDYRTNSTHEMAMYVYQSGEVATEDNRVNSFDEYLILNGETIEVHYRPKII